MTVTDQLKTIDNKIKANQAQNDLDRLAAKVSALSSNDLKNMIIGLVKIWDTNQVYLKKLNLSILHWV